MDEVIQSFICIDEDEFQRLKSNENKLFSLENLNRQTINNINSEIDSELKDKLQRLEKRQAEQEIFAYQLNGEIKRSELELQKRVNEQSKALYSIRKEYLEIFEKEKKNYLSLFLEQSDILFKAIEKAKTSNSMAISQDNINNYFDNIDKKKERVNLFLQDLKIVSESIINLPHSKFFPGKFEYAKSILLEALQDFQAGFYESCLVNARNCYKILIDLKENTLLKEQEQLYLQNILSENTKYLSELIQNNKIKNIEINNKKVIVNIEFFMQDLVNKFKRQLNFIEKQIAENYDFSITEVKELNNKIKENILLFQNQYEKNINLLISSQIRFNIAQFIAKKLFLLFFSIEDSGYLANDYKKAYFVDLKNKMNQSIKVFIEPDKKNLANHKIRIISNVKYIDNLFIKNLTKEPNIINWSNIS